MDYLKGFIKEALDGLPILSPSSLSYHWPVFTMKLGLRNLALAAVAINSTQAACPDYTTYSQVSTSRAIVTIAHPHCMNRQPSKPMVHHLKVRSHYRICDPILRAGHSTAQL